MADLIKKIEECQSAVDLYSMKDEILSALGGKITPSKATKKKEKGE